MLTGEEKDVTSCQVLRFEPNANVPNTGVEEDTEDMGPVLFQVAVQALTRCAFVSWKPNEQGNSPDVFLLDDTPCVCRLVARV